MSSSGTDATHGLGLDPEYLKYQQLMSSSATQSAVTISSNVKLDNIESLKWGEGYKLWSKKMMVIFEAMGLYEIVVMGIDPSPLVFVEEWIIFQLTQ
jgi:hypothetical protein